MSQAANDPAQNQPPPPPIDANNPLRIAVFGDTPQADAIEYVLQNPILKIMRVSEKTGLTVDQAIRFQPALSFICVHTPTKIDQGVVDASRVEDPVLKLIEHTESMVVLKSTVTPDILIRIYNSFFGDDGPHRFVYNPDFIPAEGNYAQHFVNQEYMIIGGTPTAAEKIANFYEIFSLCKAREYIKMEAVEAAFVKYGINSFLATKVTFFNQLADLVQKYRCNYNVVARGIGMDPRVGPSHTYVPGFDMERGYGGNLPKDVRAFHSFSTYKPGAAPQDTEFSLLGTVMEINERYRNPEGTPNVDNG